MKNQQGFIPLVAIILLSLVAVGGGIVATQSLQEPEQTTEVPTTTTPEFEASLAPVSPRVESSTNVTTSTSNTGILAPVERIETSVQVKVTLDTESQAVCDRIALEQIDTSKRSLSEDIRVLCERINQGRYPDGEELDTASKRLKEKWELWLKVNEANSASESRASNIETNR